MSTETARPTRWTTNDIPDQTGRTFVVTGASSGLGVETARALANSGAHVILAVRELAKGLRTADDLRAGGRGVSLEVEALDLADLASVRAFADRYRARHGRLDGLVNNAGVMSLPRQVSVDGFELQFATNHLGHFALTTLLLPVLMGTPAARVVTVSSMGHRAGRMRFDDLMGERRYSRMGAYAQSKLANLLFTYELQRRLTMAGADVAAVAAHPGLSNTPLGHAGRLQTALLRLVVPLTAQSAAQGALPTLRAATDPDAKGGQYYGPSGPGGTRGYPALTRSSAASYDEEAARRLWERSVTLTGVDPRL